MKFILFTLLLALAGYGLWNYAIEPTFFDDSPRVLRLANHEGNQLEVTLFRRDAEHVYFRSKGETTLHRYPVEQLSLISRVKVWLFPKTAAPEQDVSGFNLAQTHLNSMIQQYDDFSDRLNLLNAERDGSRSRSERSAISGEINTLLAKMDRLAYKIEDLKYRYPNLRSDGRRFKAKTEQPTKNVDDKSTLPIWNTLSVNE